MADELARAAALLREGGLVALPTETVYGLGADASNELAVRRVFAAKGRPSTHPLIVHVASLEAARAWAAALPEAAERLARAFWPGPLTVVVRRSGLAADCVTGGQDTVALRVPGHPLALRLLELFCGGIAAPSANRFGRVSPTTAEHVRADLGELVDLILDGGPCAVGVESTIVDVSGVAPRLLRPGGVAVERLEAVLGVPVPLVAGESATRAPGMLPSHYAPHAGLELVRAELLAEHAAARSAEGHRVAVLAPADLPLPPGTSLIEISDEPAGYARRLYAALREADAVGCTLILAAPPEGSGLGLAVRDRLERAAAPR